MDKHNRFITVLWLSVPFLALMNRWYGSYLSAFQQKIILVLLWLFVIFLAYFYIPKVFRIQSKLYQFLLILIGCMIGLIVYMYFFVPPGVSLLDFWSIT
jgi:TctA family transporter